MGKQNIKLAWWKYAIIFGLLLPVGLLMFVSDMLQLMVHGISPKQAFKIILERGEQEYPSS